VQSTAQTWAPVKAEKIPKSQAGDRKDAGD